jgi:acetaldehyde dehydrogenase (acetylating)
VLSGRGLCDELITHPEESYRLCCVIVCDLETSRIGAPYIYDVSNLRVKDCMPNANMVRCKADSVI